MPTFSPNAAAACVIVWEQRGLWASRLRVCLPRELSIRQPRGLEACRDELLRAPASLLIAEVTAGNLVQVLGLAAELRRNFPRVRLVGVADRRHAGWEHVLRAAGAIHFATSPRTVRELASIARRQVERAPRARLALAQQIWQSLPWPEIATSEAGC